MDTVIDFITQHKLGRYKVSGQEVEICCPNGKCPNVGQPQFYINRQTGAFYCHRCNWKGGNIKQLAFKLGLIQFKEPVETDHIYISPKDIEHMEAELLATPSAMKFLEEQRGFKRSSIVQFRLGHKTIDSNPVIVIPYFDRTDTCVGLKYYFYTRPSGVPKMKFEKNSKSQLFNINGINFEEPVVLTEGEFDAITAWQYGYENVGSVPNGAQGINGWTEEIDKADKYIICFDNDSAGQEGAKKLSEKLGASRCFRAYPQLKDLNEYLQCNLDKTEVDKIFHSAKPMFEAPITDVTQYIDSACKYLENPTVCKGFTTGWNSIDYYLGGIRLGEVTVTSGMTGHGKTTFAMSMIANLIRQDVPCLIVSPEMKEQSLLLDLANNHYKKILTEKDTQLLIDYAHTIDGKVQIANVFNQWTQKKDGGLLQQIFDLIVHSVRHKGTKFVLLDHLRLFLNPKEQENERFLIDEFMQKCVHTVIQNKVHIWLVVQPKNLPANQKKVALADLKGSSNIGQDAHNVVLIHRHTNDPKKEHIVEVEIAKNRELGLCGTVPLEFDLNSKANYYEIEKD
jgi:twinkle protein